MTKEMEFFIFLMEQYAFFKKTTANKVLEKLEERNLTNYVYDMYEIYHTEDLENAFNDIDRKMNDSK